MDAREIKKSIIDLVQKENDVDRLETILRLMENAQRDLGTDAGLLDSVLIAEREYAEGKGVSLEEARRIMKRGGEQ
jgi:hypothetical protein